MIDGKLCKFKDNDEDEDDDDFDDESDESMEKT